MTKIFQLKDPVQFGSELVTEIKLRSPRVKDLRKLPVSDLKYSDLIEIASFLIENQAPAVFELLSINDGATILNEVFLAFLPLREIGNIE